ncbi:ATG5-like protein [Mya arenaria]|uniref:Autophagy protein 5 n=1 Tax=Mya arenaria TaxID=6604 RepID=A0ABY7EF01_MYAAR|nr:ATG5-like protein [Mya arenaria]
MGDDRAILRENWDGRIPVCFSLAEDEIEQEKPENVFAHVPRQSYFPLVTEKVSKYFSQHVDKEKEFPESELLHCPGREAVESVFMSTVKEADALKHRSSIINSMQKKDHKNMFDQFWPINKKLMENTDEESIKYIPFRIYQSETGFIQKLFRPFSEEGQEHTLDDLIKHVLPDLDEDGNKRVLIQGIEVPGETPILWLSEHLSYPDNFLHICVVNQPSMTISDHW